MTEIPLADFDPRVDRVEWPYRRSLGVLLVAGEAQQQTMAALAFALRDFGSRATCTQHLSAIWDRRTIGGASEPRPERIASLLGDPAQQHLDQLGSDLSPTDGSLIVLAPGWEKLLPDPSRGHHVVSQGIIGVQRMAWLCEDADHDSLSGRVVERHIDGMGLHVSLAGGLAYEVVEGPPGEGRYALLPNDLIKTARWILGAAVRASGAKLVRKHA